MLAGYRITFKVTEKEMAEIRAAIEKLPKAIRGKIVRKGLRSWGADTAKMVKAMTRRKDVRTRRGVKVKIKTYKRGKVIWCGVGVRAGKGANDVGWKSHLHDQGYRTWAKGTKADGSGAEQGPRGKQRNPNPRFAPFIRMNKGWRKGRSRRNLGTVIYRTEYLTRSAFSMSHKVVRYVTDAVGEAIRTGGKRGQ